MFSLEIWRQSAEASGGRFGFSDVLTVFLAMDSYVELYTGGIVSMADFVSMKMDNDILISCDCKKSVLVDDRIYGC